MEDSMDFLYTLFEELFLFFESLTLEKFTGYYLLGQVLLFGLMLLYHSYINFSEKKAMNIIKKELEENKMDYQKHEIEARNNKLNSIFQTISMKSQYRQQWDRYYTRVINTKEDEKIRVEPFFGLDALDANVGKRHIMDMGGGIHVSLGVLGTFLGLSMGLSGLNSLDPEVLRLGIGGLISGMKVAFFTSVLGVSLSIVWIFIDRINSSIIEKKIDWHSNELSLLLNADDEEIFLNRLEKITQQQADQLKTVLSDALEHVMQPFVQSVQTGNQVVQNSFTEMSQSLGDVSRQIKEQSEISKEHLEVFKDQSNTISEKLIEEISGGTKDSIEQFVRMIELSEKSQAGMLSAVQVVVGKLETAATRQESIFADTENMLTTFSTLSTDIKSTQESYKESFMDFEDLSISLKTMQDMHLQQIPIQQSIVEQNQNFMMQSDSLVTSFKQFGVDVNEMQKEIFNNLVNKAELVSSRFEQLASELVKATENQKLSVEDTTLLMEQAKAAIEYMVPISEQLNSSTEKISDLSNELKNMQDIQQELIPHLESWNEGTTATVDEFIVMSKDHMEYTSNQLNMTRDSWQMAAKDFEATRNNLSSALQEFSLNIETGVTKTFNLFDKELVNVVTHFNNMTNTYLESQEEMTSVMDDFTKVMKREKIGNTP